MKVLGIDPGSHRTGYGVVEVSGARLRHVDSGTIAASVKDLAGRLCTIAMALETILDRYAPAAVAIEAVFHAKNARSALLLGHARGVCVVTAARFGLQVFEYTALQIKQSVTGRGRAAKPQVQEMVGHILQYDGEMGLDTSDALAAAICHAQSCTTPTAQALREAHMQHGRQSHGGQTTLRPAVYSFRPLKRKAGRA